jgi:peptidoglycan/xylan/chitin deacetylase (PgdA/CDA1 family)
MMALRLVLSTLLSASAVWGKNLAYRATPQVYDACINANDIALTFDDGPYIYLRSISDQFTAAGAKATFFWNGNNFDCIYNPDRIADIKYAYAAGHMVGSHTWAHADLTSLSTAQIQDAMFRMEEAFSRILGIKPAFMRPPFGDYNDNIQSIAAARGQSLALWDWDTGDADGNTTAQSEALYNDVANAKVKNALILEHETEETTASTLVPFAIKLFQGKGYNLVTMADCLGVPPYQAVGVPQQQTSAWTCDGTPDPGAACGGSIACETGTPVFSSTTTSGTTGPTPTPTPNQYIHPSASAGTCLTAASNADGAVVETEPCVAGGSTSQAWTISGSSIQIFGNKCLDVTGGATASGTKMQIWTCTGGDTNQAWTLSGNTITWSGHSSCLDLTGGSTAAGNVVQIWTCTGGPNQQWTRTTGPGSGGTTPPPPTGHTITTGLSSTTCLAAPTNANGAAVVVEPCNGSTSQAWTQNGQTLVVYGNMCLDVTNGSTTNGVKMQIWACTPGAGDAAQHFTLTSANQIQWVNTAECLDLTDGSLTSGNQVQMWACATGNTNQVWKLT